MAVGHPISDGLIGTRHINTKEKIITLVPGSRMSEVKRLMPLYREFVETLNRLGYHDYRYVIPTVETTDKYVRGELCRWPVTVDVVNANNRYNLYAKTYIAVVASGTVSAELAMMHIPAIVVYRMNPITVWLIRQFIRVRWVSLVNILLNRGVYPELLGPDANRKKLVDEFTKLTIPANRKKMVADLTSADNMWCRDDISPARIIANDLQKTKKQGK